MEEGEVGDGSVRGDGEAGQELACLLRRHLWSPRGWRRLAAVCRPAEVSVRVTGSRTRWAEFGGLYLVVNCCFQDFSPTPLVEQQLRQVK